MALDGCMLCLIKKELEEKLLGARVEKIYQPTREEVILSFRNYGGSHKLIISAKADGPRIHLTNMAVENPKQPPMFCMLMRKHLGIGRLMEIRQHGFDRILFLDFKTVNEMGDTVTVSLGVEIMGRHSNIILMDQEGKIIDSIKRVNLDMSSVRQVMPGLTYQLPPAQQKISPLAHTDQILQALQTSSRDIPLSKLLLENIEGVSPMLCREISHFATRGQDPIRSECSEEQFARLSFYLKGLQTQLEGESGINPTLVATPEGQQKDFSFVTIEQYSTAMMTKHFDQLGQLLDAFYGGKDAGDRMRQRSNDLLKLIASRTDRAVRKMQAQKEELKTVAERDHLRMKGDLLASNIHLLEKGMSEITLDNFFTEDLAPITISLDLKLTPSQNVQRYYQEYRKADTAEKMLHQLIIEGESETEYLEAVFDSLVRAKTDAELTAIREELAEGGYIRLSGGKKKASAKLPPYRYRSSDGFIILCGRNNLQNDRLTLKDSRNYDLWLHTQRIPGSHVVVLSEGREIPNRTIEEAAIIAATNSKAENSAKVAVDYTLIKFVKKHPSGKPGLVNYENFKTAIVDPSPTLLEELKADH